MTKFMLMAIAILLLSFLSSCAMFNEPPTTIYPDRKESPSNYPIESL